jgi:hypothetical protein
VIVPGTGEVQPSFAPVARHYGVVVQPCPPRRGNRKGAVESSVRYLCGRWWRTMTATSPVEAQRSLDAFCTGPGDARTRASLAGTLTVAALADAEPLENDNPIWPHCAGLSWPHSGYLDLAGGHVE